MRPIRRRLPLAIYDWPVVVALGGGMSCRHPASRKGHRRDAATAWGRCGVTILPRSRRAAWPERGGLPLPWEVPDQDARH